MNEKINNYILSNKDQVVGLFEGHNHIKKYYRRVSLTPYLIDQQMFEEIKYASEMADKLINKTIGLYFSDKRVKDFFGLSGLQDEVIRNYSGQVLHFARYDSFIDNEGKFKFLEFNINFPGGVDRLEDVNKVIKEYLGDFELNDKNNIKENYIKAIKNVYDPSCGIVTFAYGEKTEPQNIVSMQKIADLLKENGVLDIEIGHWRDFQVKDGQVLIKGKKVDLIIRTALAQRIWEYDFDLVKPILELVEAGKVKMINLPQSYIAGAKCIFALWYEKWFRELLTEEEKQFIDKFIPKTYLMSNESLHFDSVANDKDNWVLKPVEGIGGEDVYVGKETDDMVWKDVTKKYEGNKGWVLQEFISTTKINIVDVDNADKKIEQKGVYINVSPWIIDGKLAGISGRYSTGLTVNVNKGGGVIPIFVR